MTTAERFWAKVRKTETCWLWTGAISSTGYSAFGRTTGHRWSYEHANGPVPVGLQIDHLCRVRRCVNPVHLEAVTASENLRRAIHPNQLKTSCVHGHDYTVENTGINITTGHRFCRACARNTKRAYKTRQKAQHNPIRPNQAQPERTQL